MKNSDPPLLVADQLTKRYGRQLGVHGVSLRLYPRQIIGLLGPNGSGKTTTLGMLMGVIRPSAGTVRYPSHGSTSPFFSGTLERPGFVPTMPAVSTLRSWARLKGAPRKEVTRVLDLLDLRPVAKTRFSELSLGQQQRLALGVALLGSPSVLLLDEPGIGLDPAGVRDLRAVLCDLAAQGHGLIVSSHQLDELERICSDVIVLQDGEVVLQGSLEELQALATEVEVVGQDVEEMAKVLKTHPEVTGVRLEGGVLLVAGGLDGTEIIRYLGQHEIYPSQVSPRTQRLEEAFFRVTSGEKA